MPYKWTPRTCSRIKAKAVWQHPDTIAEEEGIPPRSVRYILKRDKDHDTVDPLPHGGSECKLSVQDQNYIVLRVKRCHRNDDFDTIIAKLELDISRATLHRMLLEHGYRSCAARIAKQLSASNKAARRRSAMKASRVNWAHVLFTDETKLSRHLPSSGRPRVIRRQDEAGNPDLIAQKGATNYEKLEVWGAVGLGYKSPLYLVPLRRGHWEDKKYIRAESMNGQKYTDLIHAALAPAWEEFTSKLPQEARPCTVEDNAGFHGTRSCNDACNHHGIRRFDHPPVSPDLNPIEVVWHMLKSRIKARQEIVQDFDHLWRIIQEEWAKIPQEDIDRQILKMRRRYRQVAKQGGGIISDWHDTIPEATSLFTRPSATLL